MPPSLRKAVAAAIGGGAIAIASVLITGPSGNDGLEGVSYIPYKDIVGVWTVCHGHTGKDIMLGKTYTKAECKALLNKDLATVARQINPYIKVDITAVSLSPSKAKFSVAPRLMISTRFPCSRTQAYSLQESLQPTPVRPCSGSTELWKRVKERGRVWPRVKSVRSSQYAPVTGSTGSVTHLMTLLAILFNDLPVFPSNAPSFAPSSFPLFPSRFPSLPSFARFPSFPSSPAGGRR